MGYFYDGMMVLKTSDFLLALLKSREKLIEHHVITPLRFGDCRVPVPASQEPCSKNSSYTSRRPQMSPQRISWDHPQIMFQLAFSGCGSKTCYCILWWTKVQTSFLGHVFLMTSPHFWQNVVGFDPKNDQKSATVRCVSFNKVHLEVIFTTGLAPKGPEGRQKDLELSPVPTWSLWKWGAYGI